jgi:hypothetical protein
MSYAIAIASCGMVYVPSFVKMCAGVEAVIRFCRYLTQESFFGCSYCHVSGFP